MRSGLPAWHNLASQNEKYVYRYDESSWSYETHAAPLATSEFEIRYALSKLTKQSDKFICFPTSHSLQQYFVYHSICPNCLRFLRSKAEFFVPSTLVAAMFRKSGMLDRSKGRMTLFIHRNLPQEITVMIINTGQMCTLNYSGRPGMCDLKCPDWKKNVL